MTEASLINSSNHFYEAGTNIDTHVTDEYPERSAKEHKLTPYVSQGIGLQSGCPARAFLTSHTPPAPPREEVHFRLNKTFIGIYTLHQVCY